MRSSFDTGFNLIRKKHKGEVTKSCSKQRDSDNDVLMGDGNIAGNNDRDI